MQHIQSQQLGSVSKLILMRCQQQLQAPKKSGCYKFASKSIQKSNTKCVNEVQSMVVTEERICDQCEVPMIRKLQESEIVCPVCGQCMSFLDATSSSMSYGDEVEFTTFNYQRSTHFDECLLQFQAKESKVVPNAIIEKVMMECVRRRYKTADINYTNIRRILQDLKLRLYYKHTTQITCRINGKPPPRMTPEQEEHCRLMFYAIQEPFEKHKSKARHNFLSYSYVLYKFCELLGYTEFLSYFPLLKGPDKLYKQDEMFQRICDELNWTFLASAPVPTRFIPNSEVSVPKLLTTLRSYTPESEYDIE